ncbi:MAG: nucleotidyl transferase AbiEii/AbiGii toxin family protein [Pseudomonadales bacterium]|nr:nucleotidyl transferase AbiEii/AbiGii toxin family protein [Pseudomonadales bacterium]
MDNLDNTFSDAQKQHINIMRLIAESLNDTPMVLKGGTALMLAYGLDRYSEDLDFDSTKAISLEKRVKGALRTTRINVKEIFVKKDTETVKRWMIQYSGPAGLGSLKVEVSFRKESIDADSYTMVGGIKVYKISELIEQKLIAASDRCKIRDLYDLAFLSREKPAHFSGKSRTALQILTADLNDLYSRYEADHAEDSILKGEDLEDLVLTLQQSAEELM